MTAFIDLPAEVRARRYADYLIDNDVIAYDTDEEYKAAVLHLAEQFALK